MPWDPPRPVGTYPESRHGPVPRGGCTVGPVLSPEFCGGGVELQVGTESHGRRPSLTVDDTRVRFVRLGFVQSGSCGN